MEPLAIGAVLLAAVLHATWNAVVKSGGDRFVALAVTNAACALCALPLLPVVGMPDAGAWPWLWASVGVHSVYHTLLAAGYQRGDLSLVYPIARGAAPPLVAFGGLAVAGERLGPVGWLGVATVCAGIASLAFVGPARQRPAPAILLALGTSVAIAGYTVCDGLGGRAAGDVLAYIAWLFFLEAMPFSALVVWLRRDRLGAALAPIWRPAALGGVLAFVAYGLVIWAMSVSTMANVSALRETSVVLAAWFGTRLLGEPFGGRRVAAAALVAVGVVLLLSAGAA